MKPAPELSMTLCDVHAGRLRIPLKYKLKDELTSFCLDRKQV